MSFLDKLLEGVKVEWKPLGEVATITIGEFVHQNIQDNLAEFPVYNGGVSPSGYFGKFNNTGDKIIVSARGANAGYVNRISKPYWAGNSCYSVGIKDYSYLNWIYVYYYLKNIEKHLIGNQQKGSIPSISKSQMEKLQIPVPPLEIQQKIVSILDTFIELTTEVTAELTSRKKQYSYYRERLLSFENREVEWKSLGKVTLPTLNIRWRETNNSYRYIDLTSVCRKNNIIIDTIEITKDNAPSRAQKLVLKDDVIFATTRPTQLRLCLIGEEYSGEVASTGYCVLRANTSLILPKWIYFWITSNKFKKYVDENQSGSAYPAISDAKVKDFKIPIPSIEEQEHIVSILDTFDLLTTSISKGLPKEIELRKKQYEYYRDLLLTFPKNNIEA